MRKKNGCLILEDDDIEKLIIHSPLPSIEPTFSRLNKVCLKADL